VFITLLPDAPALGETGALLYEDEELAKSAKTGQSA
jgi:hypothetical protein